MAVTENDLLAGPSVLAMGVTTISLDFFVEDEDWLEVYKSGSETPLVLDTDYTFAGESTATGVVTLTVAANGTDSYSVYLVTPLERTADLQFRGGFQSAPFNTELDRVWRAMQAIKTSIGRGITLGSTVSSAAGVIAEDIAEGYTIIRNAAGNWVQGFNAADIGNAQANAAAAAASATDAETAQTAAEAAQAAAEATVTNGILEYSGTDRLTTTANGVQIDYDDDGAGTGPVLRGDRDSASPAASDDIFQIVANAKNSADEVTNYADVIFRIVDPTDGSETGRIRFRAVRSGTREDIMALTGAIANGESGMFVLGVPPGGGSAVLKRVQFGANDSGGTGYSMMRVTNF